MPYTVCKKILVVKFRHGATVTIPPAQTDMQSLVLEQVSWMIHHWSAVLVGGGGIIKLVSQIRRLPDIIAERASQQIRPYIDQSIKDHDDIDVRRDAAQLERIEQLKTSNAERHQILHDDVTSIKANMAGMNKTLDQISGALFNGPGIRQTHGGD